MKDEKGKRGGAVRIDLKGPWKTKAAALLYLQASGWAIEKQTFYNHTNPTHKDFKLNKEKAGFTRKRVDKYATTWLVRADSGLKVGEEDNALLAEKTREEMLYKRAQRKKAEYEFDIVLGKHLPKDQLYLEIVGRAGILDSGWSFFVQSKALALVILVGGDQKKVPEFIAAMQKEWNIMLGNFARLDNIEIAFKDD